MAQLNFTRGKLLPDGTIDFAPTTMRIMITNPTDEQYESQGYMRIEEDPIPEYDPEKEQISQKIYVAFGVIRKGWVIEKAVTEGGND